MKVACLLVAFLGFAGPAFCDEPCEILWDTWGVPHVFAIDDVNLAYGFGRAQMHSHGNLLLRLFLQARGRAAEVLGDDFVESDRTVLTFDVPGRAAEMAAAQPAAFAKIVEAFVHGINDYCRAHPEEFEDPLETALPVRPEDIYAHGLRAIELTFVGGIGRSESRVKEWKELAGSNAWAIGPEHAADGNAMLLCNPHLPWSDLFTFYEAQLHTPNYDFYGCTLIGFPALAIGFSDFLGWSHTVNTYDGVDYYNLELRDGGYVFDGETRPFETVDHTIRVRQADGSIQTIPFTVKRSVHGPVLAEEDGRALAIRIAGWEKNGMLRQIWDMSHAKNLAQFETVLRRQQLPMFNVIYADAAQNIMLLFNGLVPKRATGDWGYWRGIIPGNTSETLWTEYLPYEKLPKVVNPETNWLENANEPPWYMTVPYPLDPHNFPPYLAPPDANYPGIFRPQRSQRMLLEDSSITLDELVADKLSARSELADRILDDLLPPARAAGGLAGEAADVLAAWDRCYHKESKGAVLFARWYGQLFDTGGMKEIFAKPWSNDAPALSVPDGLAHPDQAVAALVDAARTMQEAGLALDVPWGAIMRMRVGGHDLPASGAGQDTFRVLNFAKDDDGKFRATGGDTFVLAVEFSKPPRARVITTYGNSSQPNSPHRGDQLELYARDELRPVLRSREEIEANLEAQEVATMASDG